MPTRNLPLSLLSKATKTRTPIYILTVVAVIGLAAWAKSAWVVPAVPSATESAMAPALQLAAGTLKLEGSQQAIDAASAAKLLPFWQLLGQLESSSATAPQEISTVVEEIRLNMSASQLKAIDAMSVTETQLSSTSANSAKASGTQTASSVPGGAASIGMFTGGGPMDGGPMPGGPRSSSSSGSSASSSSAASPSLIDQVIQLLEKRVQG